jgi:hypothetical protein
MKGQEGSNGELHPYSKELGEHLREAKEFLWDKPNLFISEWANKDSRVFFDALLSHEDNYLTEDLKEFYKLLKDDPRPKYYFARDRNKEACKVFNMQFIEVPWPNSYSYLEQVKQQVKEIAKPDIIILFSCGMLAKIMIYECFKIEPNMTVLDMGSAFDPMFVGSTRSEDPDQHLRVKEFFNDILQS